MKVIPTFHPQSQERPVMAERFQLPAPDHSMNLKSALLADTFAATIFLTACVVHDVTKILFVEEFPFTVNVPVTVCVVAIVRVSVFVAVPVLVSVANVFI